MSVNLIQIEAWIRCKLIWDREFMRLLILFLTCFLFYGRTLGQLQYEIKGRIMDRISQQFLEKVMIKLSGNKDQVFSDEAGFFSILTFSNNTDRLELVLEGYEKVRMQVSSVFKSNKNSILRSNPSEVLVLVLIKLTNLRLRCGSCKYIFWHVTRRLTRLQTMCNGLKYRKTL